MNAKLDDLDEFEARLSICLDDLFLDARKTEAPMICIKDKDYEFNVEPEKIERAEAIKFNGREDELPWEHLINLSELANLFGNTEIQKYFLILFFFEHLTVGKAATVFFILNHPHEGVVMENLHGKELQGEL
jgi:hypothetical protein